MSTRRARIKAVTSLPPRRKNAESADIKSKQIPSKENVEKGSKSPENPRPTNEGPTNLQNKKLQSPLNSPRNTVLTKNVVKLPEPIKVPPSITDRAPTTISENTGSPKHSVISASSLKSVFVSPQGKGSPLRKPVPSPVCTPKAGIENTHKLITTDKDSNHLAKLTSDAKENITESQKSNNDRSSTIIAPSTSEAPDDYNVPSVPESVTEDAMDGIVPLQPPSSAPKPIALLKNEIISENAEVLFDPIIPLPSPSKVRPKLRPVPRLAPLRRNSVQGSASESEDESRRALLGVGSATPAPTRQRHDSHTSHSTLHSLPNRELNRIRNDSVCSSVSQAAAGAPAAPSPVKEKNYPKTRRQELSRRMGAMRRRREAVKRDALTMYDLIFYNPVANPFVPDQDELTAKEANEREASAKSPVREAEEDPDDPPAQEAAPVPQIKLGPNGEIILDEQSLVIKQSHGNRRVSGCVREGAWGGGGGGRSYRRTPRTAEWSDAETVRFYRALAAIGTDFTLMQPLFPDRTRRDLKLKFKREEKLNGGQVDKALRSTVEWDAVRLLDEFSEERAAAATRAQRERERLEKEKLKNQERLLAAKEMRVKQSRSSKTLGSSILPNKFSRKELSTADEIIERAVEDKRSTRRRYKKSAPEPCPNRTPQQQTTPQYATLTLINKNSSSHQTRKATADMATISRIDPASAKTVPENLNPISAVPSNIETGSLVVLTVNDPNSPMKKMLQTYIAHGAGRLTPVNLPPTLLNSVVGYMKKGTPNGSKSARSSPSLTSPSSVASHDSRASVTSGVIQVSSSPRKRQRHSSYTITPL